MEQIEQQEFLARLLSPIPLYGFWLEKWYYIFNNSECENYLRHCLRKYSDDPAQLERICKKEFGYCGVARGKNELNAWRNACTNLQIQ